MSKIVTTSRSTAVARPARSTAVFAAGTPGRLSAWGFRLIEEAGRFFGQPFHIGASDAAAAEAHARPLVTSTSPDAAFRAAAARAGATILFIGDPMKDLAHLQETLSQPQHALLRATTGAAVMMLGVAGDPGALVVRERATTARMAAAQILEALGFPATGEGAEALINRFAGPAEATTLAQAIDFYPAGMVVGRARPLNEALAGLAKKAVAPVFQAATTGKRATITWPRSCFFDGDRMGEPALPWVEVAGAARILYYGPYLHVPEGIWTVVATLCFSDDLESTTFSLELVAGSTPLARARVKPKRSGTFYAPFEVAIPQTDEPIELRISTDQGSIFGRMALIDVAFKPVAG
jgi:hypothetical protein